MCMCVCVCVWGGGGGGVYPQKFNVKVSKRFCYPDPLWDFIDKGLVGRYWSILYSLNLTPAYDLEVKVINLV